jgi:hypothetical protein
VRQAWPAALVVQSVQIPPAEPHAVRLGPLAHSPPPATTLQQPVPLQVGQPRYRHRCVVMSHWPGSRQSELKLQPQRPPVAVAMQA